MSRHFSVFITAPTEKEAVEISKTLVEERLCACVSILPGIRSIYRWEGKVCDEREVMLIAKTASSMAPILVKRVKELHSYDVPEIICLPITTGSGEYLDWIDDSIDPASGYENPDEI